MGLFVARFFYLVLVGTLALGPLLAGAQVSEVYDDFEGNGNISSWYGDDCGLDIRFPNPHPTDRNPSATVLRYEDTGGTFANVRFDVNGKLDLSTKQVFSLQIYLPSDGLSGNQSNQVSLKLQDGSLPNPWSTQSEIIKPVVLDEWQTLTFDFGRDNYRNLDPTSLPPTLRSDFSRVLIQVNGEDNSDRVRAYVDELQLLGNQEDEPVFDQLVWSDEFEVDGAVDPQKWHLQTQIPQGDSWFNGEIQHYTDRPANASVSGGLLRVVAQKERFTDQGVTKDYTSARLNAKFAFTYGRVEVRAKLPRGVGTWPAIWMLGKNINERGAYWQTQGYGTTGWPDCGEIDLMEHWGDNQDYVSSAIHTPSSHGATINYGGRFLPNASDAFHVYTVVWTADKIVFSVDGAIHYTYEPEVKDGTTWPFDLDQYLLFNVAMLPNVDPAFTESALAIDYVRVYQERVVTGVADLEAVGSTIYPNPFREQFDILTDRTSAGPVPVYLYDARGTLLRSDRVAMEGQRLTISKLADLPVGTYLIRYVIGGQAYVSKAIKQ